MELLGTRKRRLGSFSAVAVIATVALGLGWSREAGTSLEHPPDVGAPISTPTSARPTTTTSTAPTTTTTTTTRPLVTTTTLPGVVLPVPADLPTDENAPTPEQTLATLEIPALGLVEQLHEGMTLTAINRGPSHWPGTAVPGQLGNVVIGGHRTTYTQPFRYLDQLQPGDELIFTTADARYVYQLTGTEVVDPAQLQIADQTVAYTATLFACHPPGSARYRLVAHFQLVDDAGQPVVHAPASIANAAAITHFRT